MTQPLMTAVLREVSKINQTIFKTKNNTCKSFINLKNNNNNNNQKI